MPYKKSPVNKELIGNQHKLPEHLKAKIKAAPEMKGSPYMNGGSPLAKYGGCKTNRK